MRLTPTGCAWTIVAVFLFYLVLYLFLLCDGDWANLLNILCK